MERGIPTQKNNLTSTRILQIQFLGPRDEDHSSINQRSSNYISEKYQVDFTSSHSPKSLRGYGDQAS